jgi:hypothetical protein
VGTGSIYPRILDLGTSCRWSATRPGSINPWEKSPRYPLDGRLGGPQNLYGHVEDKNPALPRLELRPLGRKARSVPAIEDITE